MTETATVTTTVTKKCYNCEQRGTICEFKEGKDKPCQSCQSFKDKCAPPLSDFTDEELAARISASTLPTTEAEKKTELKQLSQQGKKLDFELKRLMLEDWVSNVGLIVEKYWKWTIFFYPVFGMITPMLLLTLGMLLMTRLPIRKERVEMEESLKKVTARASMLQNAKIPGKELSCLEFVGIIALLFGGTVILFTVVGLLTMGNKR